MNTYADMGRAPAKFTGRLIWYGATVFITSAILLVLEIVAGRLLAPYIGVSLYTWTSIIGVILAGLSLGNWVGGVIADRGASETTVGVILAIGALACFGILSLLMLVARPLQVSELSLLSASFVYVLSLFFLPAVLLGVVTPLLTTIALKLDDRTGHVVGRMHALAALGSIVGTFVTGYWLVQTIGTKNIVMGTSAVLACLAVPYLKTLRPRIPIAAGALLLFGALAFTTYKVQGFVNPCDRESNYYCLRVVDEHDFRGQVAARSLVLDHLSHSINVRSAPDDLWMSYVHAMDEMIHYHRSNPGSLRYFFAGGGAYTLPRALRYRYPDADITVSEIDPMVTAVAKSELYFDSDDIRIIHGDARIALQSLEDGKFDVVVTDVYHDIAIPYHLTTVEYHRLVKSRLETEGMHLMNVVDAFPDAMLVKSISKTLQTQFRYVDIWLEPTAEVPTRMTYLISATDRFPPPESLKSQNGEYRIWHRVTDYVHNTGTPVNSTPILRDDFAPVEKLVSTMIVGKAGL